MTDQGAAWRTFTPREADGDDADDARCVQIADRSHPISPRSPRNRRPRGFRPLPGHQLASRAAMVNPA